MNQLFYTYYLEVNLICLALLAVIYMRLMQNRSIISTPTIALRRVVLASGILCISDICAAVFRGQTFPGADIILQISNMVYIGILPIISLCWCLYVFEKTRFSLSRKHRIILALPTVIFILVLMTNPITGFFFSIGENNIYTRGDGVFIHWIISWAYLIYGEIISIRAVRKSATLERKNEYKPLMYFLIVPAIACALQMVFYGITVIQAGIILSLILVFIKMQNDQILVDELTGLSNRKALRYRVDEILRRNGRSTLMVMTIDVNNFKEVNDTLGHTVGDTALRNTSDILSDIRRDFKKELFLCRMGGDEFVVVGNGIDKDEAEELVNTVRSQSVTLSADNGKIISLTLSAGYVLGICDNGSDFEHHLRMSDVAMYEDKSLHKKRRIK